MGYQSVMDEYTEKSDKATTDGDKKKYAQELVDYIVISKGQPHLGHIFAFSLISAPHSEHLINAILSPYLIPFY